MNKWWCLFVFFFCWLVAGFVLFDRPSAKKPAENQPEKTAGIISTAPNITEILFALGLEEKIIGVTSDSTYPPAAVSKLNIGNFWQPDMEAIIAARPDLIITLGYPLYPQQQFLADRLSHIGYNCLTVFHNEQVGDLFYAVEKIALATQTQGQANILMTGIKQKLAGISRLAGNGRKERVLYVVQREPLRVAGRDTFINEMITLAGGENAIGLTRQKYPPIGAEQLIVCNPDVIIEPTMGQKNTEELRTSAIDYWSRFKNIHAVKNMRIYIVDDDTISQLGPRLADGVEAIARCIKPEIFGNPAQ
jgi:iron complex transport system substrate-binding protein